ncbi:MAG: alpha-galactosidase, partial [Deltaproteobacteria bacterium]|nr:alpha-galactosidase [Deltaproteobacteria bacterium]
MEIVPQKGALSASNGLLEILIHPGDGTFDLLDKEGLYIFKDAFSKAVFLKEGKQKTITTADSVLTYIIAYKAIADNLGKGAMIEISFFGFEAGLSLIMRFHLYGGESFVNVSAAIEVPDGQEMFLAELTPVYADYESGGAFFLGANPGVHRILDNGYDKYFDFDERLALAGDNFSPIYGPGNVSNWNNLVYDPESGKSMASGFLKFARSYGLITVDYVPDKSVADSFSRSSFSFFSARCLYEPAKSLKKTDEPFESEALSIDFSKGTPHENLESYAARVAKFNGKKVWQQGHEIPTGWNSWGEHGRDIDEEMILENLDLMVKDFQPFGMEYFHIDDGWQVAYGDWVTNKNRFPDHDGVDGMKWLAEKIRSYGLKPGLWIAPFWAKSDSTLIEDHPEWLLPLQKDAALFVPEDTYPLDISNPQVKEWLKEIFERVVNDWGYEWIKLDFGYYVMFGKEFYEMDKTAAEIYREGLQLIKDILGEDRFLLSVAIMGLNYDIADGMRLTLDNKPYWGDPYLPGEQGIKVTVRSAARRYYLNYLWLNHPDLVYFRTDEGMTMNEAIAFASFSGLFGGIVKFGESFVTMHPHDEWLKVARSLMPV